MKCCFLLVVALRSEPECGGFETGDRVIAPAEALPTGPAGPARFVAGRTEEQPARHGDRRAAFLKVGVENANVELEAVGPNRLP